MTWPKNAVLSLIEAYKDHPCLYSIRHLNYRNKIARRKAFEIIYSKLQHILPNVSFQELKMKVKSLRTTFIVEHRKFSALVLNGAESYSPNLWYYDRLLFLADPVPTWQIKTNDGQIITNPSRHRPNILRERKINNNKPLEPAPSVELKTEDLHEIKDDILVSNQLIQLINLTCTPIPIVAHKEDDKLEELKVIGQHEEIKDNAQLEEYKDDDQLKELKDDDQFKELQDGDQFKEHQDGDKIDEIKNDDKIEELKDDKLEELNDSEDAMDFEDSPESICCTSPKIFIPPVDDNLDMNLNNAEKKQNVNVEVDNAECTKQIKAFCNFVDSSLHMIKNSKAQMAVQRQITRLLYDALDNM